MANITGWGRSTWGSNSWGQASPVVLSGLSATSALGTATTVSENNVPVTLGGSTGSVGTPNIRIIFSTTVTGQSATGQVGSVTFDAEANLTLPSLVSSVGTPTVDTIGNGWGRSTWGSGPFGMPVSQTRTVTISGFAMTSALGTTTAFTTVDISVTGFAITSALGTLSSITGTANITPASQVGTSALGTVAAQGSAVAALPGLTSTLGSVSVVASGGADITLTGFAITSSLGTMTTQSDNRFGVPSVQATASLSSVSISGSCNLTVTGLSATGETSSINIWTLIDDSQTPNWEDVAA